MHTPELMSNNDVTDSAGCKCPRSRLVMLQMPKSAGDETRLNTHSAYLRPMLVEKKTLPEATSTAPTLCYFAYNAGMDQHKMLCSIQVCHETANLLVQSTVLHNK